MSRFDWHSLIAAKDREIGRLERLDGEDQERVGVELSLSCSARERAHGPPCRRRPARAASLCAELLELSDRIAVNVVDPLAQPSGNGIDNGAEFPKLGDGD